MKSQLKVAIMRNEIKFKLHRIMKRQVCLIKDVFNFSMVDGFAHVADRKSFQMLVDKVFVEDITWGKIVTLICVVGKFIAKVCSAFLILPAFVCLCVCVCRTQKTVQI